MARPHKTSSHAEAWESGKLGQEEKYVKRADGTAEQALDDAIGLQMISVRLQKALVDDLKFIARHNGIGYQPLMRDILTRFAKHEKMQILRDKLEQMELQEKQAALEARPQKVADEPEVRHKKAA